jgi:hypothetical protein
MGVNITIRRDARLAGGGIDIGLEMTGVEAMHLAQWLERGTPSEGLMDGVGVSIEIGHDIDRFRRMLFEARK